MYDKFQELREQKGSSMIVGLDPRVGNEADERTVRELAKISDGIIGFKPNGKFYFGREELLLELAQSMDPSLIRMLDAKLSDGINTNRAEIEAITKYFDSVTIRAGADSAPTIALAKNKLYTVGMGVMSFPAELLEMHTNYKIMKGNDFDDDTARNLIHELRLDSVKALLEGGVDALVMGGTAYIPEERFGPAITKLRTNPEAVSLQNIPEGELETLLLMRNRLFKGVVELTANTRLLYLTPGFGRQGGNFDSFFGSGIDGKRVLFNAGSDAMKSEDPRKYLREMNAKINSYL